MRIASTSNPGGDHFEYFGLELRGSGQGCMNLNKVDQKKREELKRTEKKKMNLYENNI
jgi:hypothetical protein